MSILLGLTGLPGSGKTTTAEMFKEKGVRVFNADKAVKELIQTDEGIKKSLRDLFPGCVDRGALNLEQLRETIYFDLKALQAMESLLHPKVLDAINVFIENHRSVEVLMFEVPLLFEFSETFWKTMDYIIVTTCPFKLQQDRILQRVGMTKDKHVWILAQQLSQEEKEKRADFILDTSLDLGQTEEAINSILKQIV